MSNFRRLSQMNPTLYDLGPEMTPAQRRAQNRALCLLLLILIAIVAPFVAFCENSKG